MSRSFDNVEMSEAYRRKIIADGMRTLLQARAPLPQRTSRWRLIVEAVGWVALASAAGAALGFAM
jgi:hypothetical protein